MFKEDLFLTNDFQYYRIHNLLLFITTYYYLLLPITIISLPFLSFFTLILPNTILHYVTSHKTKL